MAKTKLVYICSLRNAAADRAGQQIEYKGALRYMKSPLEYLVEELNGSALGEAYSLEGVLFDDDPSLPGDVAQLDAYGFACRPGGQWFFPADLAVQGRSLNSLFQSVPSGYRRHPLAAPQRVAGKRDFEQRLLAKLDALDAQVVLLDGLLIILDQLARPDSSYARRIVNIHPGITRIDSPYERRGARATLDALYGARGQKVVDWTTMETVAVAPAMLTGASFHYVDQGIDSGEVIVDVLETRINPEDTILELRWNNFNRSLFPALRQGLLALAA